MPNTALTPARIDLANGVPYAPAFDDVYHSSDGGPAQARHVFLAGNGLPARWRGRDRFAVLEIGFGLGLNFLCTATEFLADAAAPARLHYVGVEKHPPTRADLERMHGLWRSFAMLAQELHSRWPPLMGGFHRIELAEGRIALTLALGDVRSMLSEIASNAIDAVYLDGFAPAKNPAMWDEPVYREIDRIARPHATAATWSVASRARSGLASAGFHVEKRRGFGRKREMLAASRGQWTPQPVPSRSKHAVIIGAGVAGCWMAHALMRRGWHVDLLEQHEAPARAASGNAVGALLPALNLADNVNARLARAAFLYTGCALGGLHLQSDAWQQTGLLQIAMTAQQQERMQRILAVHAFPAQYASWIDAEEGSERAGQRVASGGWWIPSGGWVAPAKLCRALLQPGSGWINAVFNARATCVERRADVWSVLDEEGRVIAQAPTLVLANAIGASRLGIPDMPALITVRGQVTYLPPSATRLDIVLCGDGYLAPLPDGGLCAGATFEPDSAALELRADDHATNIARVGRMLPDYPLVTDVHRLTGRVALRTATRDRVPVCGALRGPSNHTGLYVLAGLGARGMIWAPLCAEIVACELEAEPRPIERSLHDALNPHRWADLR